MQQKSSDDSSILLGSGHPVAVSGDEGCAAPGAVKAGAKERNGGIDALRAAVTLLVVFHHTAITYGAIGGWYYKEIAPSKSIAGLLLILFCTVNQAWFMGLFFCCRAITRRSPMTDTAPLPLSASGCCGLVSRSSYIFLSYIR